MFAYILHSVSCHRSALKARSQKDFLPGEHLLLQMVHTLLPRASSARPWAHLSAQRPAFYRPFCYALNQGDDTLTQPVRRRTAVEIWHRLRALKKGFVVPASPPNQRGTGTGLHLHLRRMLTPLYRVGDGDLHRTPHRSSGSYAPLLDSPPPRRCPPAHPSLKSSAAYVTVVLATGRHRLDFYMCVPPPRFGQAQPIND